MGVRWADELVEFSTSMDAWCIFDNTASGAAAEHALEMRALVRLAAAEQAHDDGA